MTQTETQTVRDIICDISMKKDRQRSFQFFILFSKFECALKRNSKFLKSKKIKINTAKICLAEAHWNEFSKANNCKFHPLFSSELSKAVEYFKATPPKIQIVKNKKLEWHESDQYAEGNDLLVWIVNKIKTVRNNLFHGGKFPGEPVSDPSRDQELMKHAITILLACLDLDEDVKAQFLEGIDA